jgi:ribosomal subunit interface protein
MTTGVPGRTLTRAMQVSVRAHNVDVTDRLRAMAQRKLGVLERMVHDAWRVEVDFAEQRNPRISDHSRCAARLHVRRGVLTAHAAAPKAEVALDLVVAKLRHQLERIKGRRVDARTRRL